MGRGGSWWGGRPVLTHAAALASLLAAAVQAGAGLLGPAAYPTGASRIPPPAEVPLAAGADAKGVPAAAGAAGENRLALSTDRSDRLTIPVTINGKGPFLFVIDTGADRTVLSRELALTLGLPPGPEIAVSNSGGVDVVSSAVVDELRVGDRTVRRVEAPLLKAADIGAAGMLGIDSLKDQRVILDFRARELRAAPSRPEGAAFGTIVVRGKSRFGQLVLVDAEISGERVFVILDSGAQNSIGNPALQRALTRGPGPEVTVVSVTGRETRGQYHEVAELDIGALKIRNMPIAFADLATFRRFGLEKQPALLLGMDVLGLCRRVSVDFPRREASFTLY